MKMVSGFRRLGVVSALILGVTCAFLPANALASPEETTTVYETEEITHAVDPTGFVEYAAPNDTQLDSSKDEDLSDVVTTEFPSGTSEEPGSDAENGLTEESQEEMPEPVEDEEPSTVPEDGFLAEDELDASDSEAEESESLPISPWVKNTDGSRSYLVDGIPVTGWINGSELEGGQPGARYYFDGRGILQTGFFTVNGVTYYASPLSGAVHGGVLAFFDEDDRTLYLADENGAMQFGDGWTDQTGNRYFLEFNGEGRPSKVRTGLVDADDGRYLFRVLDGALVTEETEYDGIRYYMDALGRMLSGFHRTGDGMLRYLVDGVAATGFFSSDASRYYADASGVIRTGKFFAEDGFYLASEDGVLQGTGWHDVLSVDGTWQRLYLDENGAARTGEFWIDGQRFWACPDTGYVGNAIIEACYNTAFPGYGYCALWVANVYENAGLGHPWGNACDMYYYYCTSKDPKDLKPGMLISVASHPYSYMGGIYGHVGIYIGDGLVRHSVYDVSNMPLDEWCDYYGEIYWPHWGWGY